jgi:hypothetical protein
LKKESLSKYSLKVKAYRQCAEWLELTRDRWQVATSGIGGKVNASDRIAHIFRVHKKVIQGSWANAD